MLFVDPAIVTHGNRCFHQNAYKDQADCDTRS